MSKSLKRVKAALNDAGLDIEIVETTTPATTAQQAADAANCHVDQILKSIIFLGETSGKVILFMTSGGNRVCATKAAILAGEPLGKADAAIIRAQTGFAIGGVSPVGHINEIRAFMDKRLLEFPLIWAAAGTPRHIFPISPQELQKISNVQVSDFTE